MSITNSLSPRRLRQLVAGLGLLLLLVFASSGLLQSRQLELLNASRQYQDDYLVWSVFQYEVEYLKLRSLLAESVQRGDASSAQAAAERFEIFVSRLGLIEGEHAAKVLGAHADYRRMIADSRALVSWADALPLDATLIKEQPEQVRTMQEKLAGLAPLITELSVTASHHVAEQVNARTDLVRKQSSLSLGLTLLQCALALGLAVVVMLQLRSLARHGRRQRALSRRLRKARRAAEAGSRAKSTFLANMSHELRTPLHGLLGMLELLRDSRLDDVQRLRLRAAQDSAQHLLAILNDILDLSKTEAGALSIHDAPLQPARLLRELDEACHALARAKQLGLSFELDARLPPWILADATRLRQILLNLLSNAIKFTDQGQVTLRLDLGTDAQGQPRLHCQVRDSGIGMDEALLGRLFQRFSQGDDSSSRRHGGTGLGLEISRNLARAMGGDIRVSSQAGQGSCFLLDLPLHACEAPVPELEAPARAKTAPERPLRILVAEDHATNRLYLEAVLEQLGHKACFCSHGFEALQQFSRQDFDLVLMDLHMPVMDGYAASAAMRALPGRKGQTPIVALSADAFADSRRRALQAGMSEFLAKPLDLRALSALLDRLARQEASTQAEAPQAVELPPSSKSVPAGVQAPEFDEGVLQNLVRNLPPKKVPGLYQCFVRELPESLERLEVALLEPDTETLRATAHALKGASANLGLKGVCRAARELERAVHEGADASILLQTTLRLRAALERSTSLCAERGLL